MTTHVDQQDLTVQWRGDRICAPYRDAQERRAASLPFLLHGLADGGSGVYLLTSRRDDVRSELADGLGPWSHGDRIEIVRLPDAMWETPMPVATWIRLLSRSIRTDLSEPTCVVVELFWPGSTAPDASVLTPFQTAVDQMADGPLGATVLCLYDARSISGVALLEVLRTSRPRLLMVGDTLLDNPYAAAGLAAAT